MYYADKYDPNGFARSTVKARTIQALKRKLNTLHSQGHRIAIEIYERDACGYTLVDFFEAKKESTP
jgi:hypothetical protein